MQQSAKERQKSANASKRAQKGERARKKKCNLAQKSANASMQKRAKEQERAKERNRKRLHMEIAKQPGLRRAGSGSPNECKISPPHPSASRPSPTTGYELGWDCCRQSLLKRARGCESVWGLLEEGRFAHECLEYYVGTLLG